MADGAQAPLHALLEEIAACHACAHELPHAPRPVTMVTAKTRLLICGQAPGRRVHESGRPFTDASGDRLRAWMGVDAAAFYGDPRIGVASQAFCYPGTSPKGGDHPPPPRCAALWRDRLLAALPGVELTVLVGGHAQAWALGPRMQRSMTETVRAWRELAPAVIPLPHPSWRNTGWLKREPWFEAELLPVLKAEVARVLAR